MKQNEGDKRYVDNQNAIVKYYPPDVDYRKDYTMDNRNFYNKARDDWREDAMGGDQILPRDYKNKLNFREKSKTLGRAVSQAELNQNAFHKKNRISPFIQNASLNILPGAEFQK